MGVALEVGVRISLDEGAPAFVILAKKLLEALGLAQLELYPRLR
jgi:hypothetical protein